MQAREAVVVVVGARAPEWRTRIVRDNKTGRLAEVSLVGEEDPIDPGDPGRTYVFKKGERVLSDHEAVIDCPGMFMEAEELVLVERR
jgi:hypothetical protein